MEVWGYFSSFFVSVFIFLALFDGIYFHFFKFQLHHRENAVEEHATHTLSSVIFLIIFYLLFLLNSGAYFLWLAAALIVLDLFAIYWDGVVEKRTRGASGVPAGEKITHSVLSVSKISAWITVLFTKPLSAWNLSGPNILSDPGVVIQSSYFSVLSLLALLLVVFNFVMGGVSKLSGNKILSSIKLFRS